MMKKKSYMNKENILSEGFYIKLFKFLLPKGVREKLTKKQISNIKNTIQVQDRTIKSFEKKQDEAKERMLQALEKEVGRDIKRHETSEDALDAFYKKYGK
mgnify:CR=1 FL=1|tara:strand:+ start:417 stop:716 length:300 start_codon:yes stop_codon:yes gene_type:complete